MRMMSRFNIGLQQVMLEEEEERWWKEQEMMLKEKNWEEREKVGGGVNTVEGITMNLLHGLPL